MPIKPGSQTEYWNLPVGKIKELILTCFTNLNQSFAAELNTATIYGSLSSKISYTDDREPADGPAQIDLEKGKEVITIYEPYLAFLWCFCYLFITFRATKRPNHQISNEKISQAIALFNYGLSLFKEWNEWDSALPNPAKYDEKEQSHMAEVNALYCHSAAFILCHEFAHFYYGHVHSHASSPIADEFLADDYALDIFMKNMDVQGEEEKESKRLGAIIGLSSILFASNSWDGGTTHPDSDDRLKKVMNELAQKPNDSLWPYGVLVLSLWGITYHKSCPPFSPDISKAKDEFYRLAFEMKVLQAE